MTFEWVSEVLCHGQRYPRYFAKQTSSRMGGYICNSQQFATLQSNRDWDIYLHLNPTSGTRASPKAASADVTHFTNLLVDVDVISGPPPFSTLLDVSLDLLDQLDTLVEGSSKAAHILFSGRGMQMWVPFTPLELGGYSHRREVESASRNVLAKLISKSEHCKVDTSCSDLARVARCPGTVNSKNGAAAKLHCAGQGICDPAHLLRYASPPKAKQTFNLTSTESVGYVLPYVSARAADFLSKGVPEPGRHAAAYAAAASLRELDIPLEVAEIWVAEAGHLCSPSLSPAECYRATRNAYQHENL